MARTTTIEKRETATEVMSPNPEGKKFPLKLRVSMKPYEFDGKTGTSAVAELLEPFSEYAEEFNEIRIAPRWERDAAIFKFRMKVYFRTHDDVVLDGYCEPVGYEAKNGKDKGKMIYYPGLFFHVPYAGEPIEFGFKRRVEKDKDGNKTFSESPDCYVFRDIVSEKWGGSYEPAVSSVPDEGMAE